MLSTKNVTGGPWTTVLAIIIVAIIPLGVAFNFITPEQGEALKGYLPQLMEAITNNAFASIITVVASILLLFIKDPALKKK